MFNTDDKPEETLVENPELDKKLEEIRKAINAGDDGSSLVNSLQNNREFLLKYAMNMYLQKPTRVGLLETITTLLSQMESSVRNDRKEKLKQDEQNNNTVGFHQMMEALDKIAKGNIKIPTFTMTNFLLDPNKSLLEANDGGEVITPINPEELKQGIELVDLDGKPIDARE